MNDDWCWLILRHGSRGVHRSAGTGEEQAHLLLGFH
jgi:hypothetical protein